MVKPWQPGKGEAMVSHGFSMVSMEIILKSQLVQMLMYKKVTGFLFVYLFFCSQRCLRKEAF